MGCFDSLKTKSGLKHQQCIHFEIDEIFKNGLLKAIKNANYATKLSLNFLFANEDFKFVLK